MGEDEKQALRQFMEFEEERGYYNTDYLKDFEYRIRMYNEYYFK